MKDSVHIKFFGYYNTFFQGYIDEYVMDIISEYSYRENKYIGDIIADVEELANTGCGIDSVYDIYPTHNEMQGMDTTSLIVLSLNKQTVFQGVFDRSVPEFERIDLEPIQIEENHYSITFHDYGKGEILYSFMCDDFDVEKLGFRVKTLEIYSDYHTIVTDVYYDGKKINCTDKQINYRGPMVEFE